ncbi:hypothetical protein G3N55_04430 [Dissulfurirhabdus thermomarina]|uniref:Uncharacterized protein n=1 Tax=Dissulfurirhabdus thermomarina TaxID=1765737 RepID=A0A6N9TQT6_DISTH|nr:hypothetical protein [Dissulfurirhabdus thermomarina]NDY42094.1 hypothetical protein [Dissulfurirhabdus thermomarina]NMX22494.1 hypothetical protein [Dissulfurirhabdus thermomarina]
MKRSYCHHGARDILAHYLSPLHLFSPVIRCACRTRFAPVRWILCGVVSGYDRIYKSFMV